MPSIFDKDPQAILPYLVQWGDWLAGDTIATSTWTLPDGITKDSDSHTTSTSTIWLSGGTAGAEYELVNHIVTNSDPPKEEDRTITIIMRHR